MKELVTAERIAELLKVSRKTVINWGAVGKIPRVIVSPTCVRFCEPDVMDEVATWSVPAQDNGDEQ